jgi:hypothetical protein
LLHVKNEGKMCEDLTSFGVVTIQRAKKASECKENNQNWINIYVLPFKAMAIMASYCFFIHMNVKEFKPKIHLMKF